MSPRSQTHRRLQITPRTAFQTLLILLTGVPISASLAGCAGTSGQASGAPTATPTRVAPTATPPTGSTPSAVASSNGVPVPSIDQLREQAIGAVSPAIIEVRNVGVGLGSGVIMSKDGYIVTNNHVVSGAHQIVVVLTNGQKVGAKLIGADPVDDIAVIKISASRLPVARFGNSSALKVGESALAIGNPLGIASTVTEGIISALDRTVSEGKSGGSILDAIQTSAAINPGNSGGALINLAGQVVGIPTLTAVDPEFNTPANGVGFAIPSNTVQRLAAQIIKFGKVVHSGRAAIGVGVIPVTPQYAAVYNLPVDHGVLILQLTANGPAQKAGLRSGDIITKIGPTAIASQSDVVDILAAKKPGDKVSITAVTPQGGTHAYIVTLGELAVNGAG